MTNEQREAIKICEHYKNILYACNYEKGPERTGQAIETALSLIKEQQEKMENKDKQIDLMADFMYKTGTGRRALSCVFRQNDECNENGCEYCIKRYFAGLVERK